MLPLAWPPGTHEEDPAYFASLIRSCGKSRDVSLARQLHSRIQSTNLRYNKFLANLLVEMYGKCGALYEATQVFDRIHQPNSYSWNILLAAYTQNGHLEQALRLLKQIPSPDRCTYTTIITALTKVGLVMEARTIFDRMPERNLITWNSLFAAYAHNGHLHEAKQMFDKMPNRSPVSWTIMFAAYARAGLVDEAKALFDMMPEKDLVAWNVMITVHTKAGRLQEARCLLDSMPEPDAVSWTEMITAYAESSQLEQAEELFRTMPVPKDTVTWTAMMSAYVSNGEPRQALVFFKLMDLEGVHVTKVTFIAALDACACIPCLATGKILHVDASDQCFEADVAVTTAIVNMYGKCARLAEARDVFESFPVWGRDVVLWNAMITSYARTVHHSESVTLFGEMALEGLCPDSVTLLGLLTACSGRLEESWSTFVLITREFGVVPSKDCYASMSDLLGRAGTVEAAEQLLKSMPHRSDGSSWLALLSACKMHDDICSGRRAAEKLVEIEPDNPCSYVLFSNMHAQGGK